VQVRDGLSPWRNYKRKWRIHLWSSIAKSLFVTISYTIFYGVSHHTCCTRNDFHGITPQPQKIILSLSLSISSKNGEKDSLIWLSILGKVYDVTEGKEYYGPGESYNSLTAADTSVPFVSGTFTPEEAKKDPGTDFELYFGSFRWLPLFSHFLFFVQSNSVIRN